MKKSCFKRCDLLNISIPLSYRKQYYFSTNIGATLSIFLFIITSFTIIYEIIVLYKKNSFTLTTTQYTDLSQMIDFSKTPFLFLIVNDKGQKIDIDERLIQLEAYDIELYLTKDENGKLENHLKSKKLELETCDKIFSNNSEYSSLILNNYICIKPGQNVTAYGLFGDVNHAFKGIRIYINKCNGINCYNQSTIEKKLHNSKFYITYLSLSSNTFYLNNKEAKYQLFSKYFSLSTKILKKMTFTYDVGQFYLYDSIILKNKMLFNYILGNDFMMDVDLDPSATISNNKNTIAYVMFSYGGKIIETRKQVDNIFTALTVIGNLFNIVLTLFKIINNYYSHKILFIDIFHKVFFDKEYKNKEKINNTQNKETIHIQNIANLNKNTNLNKKENLDSVNLSNEVIIKQNLSKKKKLSKLSLLSHSGNCVIQSKNYMPKNISKIYIEYFEHFKKAKLLYYYLLPIWIIKRNKILRTIYLMKEKICEHFSIEKINELILFKELLKDNLFNSKNYMGKTEFIKFDSKNLENYNLDYKIKKYKNK